MLTARPMGAVGPAPRSASGFGALPAARRGQSRQRDAAASSLAGGEQRRAGAGSADEPVTAHVADDQLVAIDAPATDRCTPSAWRTVRCLPCQRILWRKRPCGVNVAPRSIRRARCPGTTARRCAAPG